MATHDKLIFPSTITWILCHFPIPIPDSNFTAIGAIDVGSVRQSEAQLQPKRPRVESTSSVTSVVPSSSAPSSSVADVTLEAIMAQLQRMDACLDTFSDELCQVNTCVDHIAGGQAHLSGFVTSPSLSLEALTDEDAEDSDDGDDKDASSSSDDDMMTSR